MNVPSSISRPRSADTEDYSEFSLVFERAVGRGGRLHFVNHGEGKKYDVALDLDDHSFLFRALSELPPVVADLADLTSAIFAADRLAPQRLHDRMRRIRVTVPLRYPEKIDSEALEQLKALLLWATATRWEFDFVHREAPPRHSEYHYVMPLVSTETQVVLWSGGLDALAGVYAQLRSEPELSIVLFGSGSNDRVLGKQKTLAKHLQRDFPGRVWLHQIPIRLRGVGDLPKNKLMRVRGVVFALLGSLQAFVLKQRCLHLHENGVGALNLPYRESSIGLDQVRSAHPFTLHQVSRFLSNVLEEEFTVENPSFLLTKAEMCSPMAEDGRVDLPPLTESCDSFHRKSPGQCGYCSSCLLRRQALAAAGFPDRTQYVVTHGEPPRRDPSIPLRAILGQVETLRRVFHDRSPTSTQSRWEVFTRAYPILDDIVDRCAPASGLTPADMKLRLIGMYERYVEEWDRALDQLSVGILDWSFTPASSDQQVPHL